MSSELQKIKAKYNHIINSEIFCDGHEIDLAMETIELVELIKVYEGETEELWDIGEFEVLNLSSLIVVLYHVFADSHGGQWSQEYQAFSTVSGIYSPGCGGLDEDLKWAHNMILGFLGFGRN